MKPIDYLKNSTLLEKKIVFFMQKNHLRQISQNRYLVFAHLDKAKHNLKFFELNRNNSAYSDWLIVILYYSLYHCALALVSNKSYSSQNHLATILFIMKEYILDESEINLIEELSLKKEDAQIYMSLKKERHDASYSTNSLFSKEKVEEYRVRVIKFLQKTENIISQHIQS